MNYILSDFNVICRICLIFNTKASLKKIFSCEAAKLLNFCQFLKVHTLVIYITSSIKYKNYNTLRYPKTMAFPNIFV